MLNLMKNRFLRVPSRLHIIIIAVIIMPLIIGAAIYFTRNYTPTYKVAFVSDQVISYPAASSVQIDFMKERPAASTLAMGKYTAWVEVDKDGEYIVTTFKDASVKKAIESYFESGLLPIHSKTTQRGIGTNILGMVLMLALMQGVALTTFYPDDRNNSTFKRILTSPVNSRQYLMGQGIFTFICLYVPTFLTIAITKICFKIDIGFELGTLAVLLAILTALATAFALFMASIMDRNISLATSGISIVTCILAGCLFNYTNHNKVLDMLSSFFPQKEFMSLTQGVESGGAIQDFTGQITYIAVWVIALWLVGSIITNKKIKRGVY